MASSLFPAPQSPLDRPRPSDEVLPSKAAEAGTTARPLLGERAPAPEQGSCGIRRKLLKGGHGRQFAVSRVEIGGARPHYHARTWELYIVQEGEGTLVLDGQPHALRKGDVVEIPPGVVHEALPAPAMTVLVVMSPQNAETDDLHYA